MKFWRMRFRCNEHEVTKQAWQQHLIGIWYGGWGADDFRDAIGGSGSSNPIAYLAAVSAQQALRWNDGFPKQFLDTARRFWAITPEDWVFTYFEDAVHLAHVCSDVSSHPESEFNFDGEIFKYRTIADLKSFSLSKVPDSFRQLTMSGRSNVHEVPGVQTLMEILAASKNEEEAAIRFSELEWDPLMNALGPGGWESLSLGYLIYEEQFVPGALRIGGTLPSFDIVGRSRLSEARILAQCKKDPQPTILEQGFLDTCAAVDNKVKLYLFAYSGCANAPANLKVITGPNMKEWFTNTANGLQYRRLLQEQ